MSRHFPMVANYENMNYECKVCENFTEAGNLRKHEFVHSDEKKQKCKVCDKTFTHAGTLRNLKVVHKGEKMHNCKVCEKIFSSLVI